MWQRTHFKHESLALFFFFGKIPDSGLSSTSNQPAVHTTYIHYGTEREKCQEIKCVCILIPTYMNFFKFPSYKANDALESRDASTVRSPWRSSVGCVAKPCLKGCWFDSCRGGSQSPAGAVALCPAQLFPCGGTA